MKTLSILLLLLPVALHSQTQGTYHYPYKTPDFTQVATLFSLLTQQPPDSVLAAFKTEKSLRGEEMALFYEFSKYNLSAPPQRTDGRTGYAEAERPFLAMVYTGLGICNLATRFRTSDLARRQLQWLLQVMQMPAISGFMTPHFGAPFGSQSLEKTSVFIHGHFLYLALHYRNAFNTTEYDPLIHKIAEALSRDFSKQPVLASYPSMWYPVDNLPALAALRIYDNVFKKSLSQKPIEIFLSEVKAHYLDAFSGLMSSYVNAVSKKPVSGPQGVGVMYGLIYLNEIDTAFAEQQWQLAKKYMIREITQLATSNGQTALFSGLLSSGMGNGLFVCLEYPDNPAVSAADPNKINGDSGPIFMGAGTSASGFALAAARTMGDEQVAAGLEKLAISLGKPAWISDKLYYINMIHPAGQAVVFFAKTF